ncbi:hypothetical protein ACFC09_39585 [Streptomyces sp. NPDC056161]|uniref:hypothetical protein n=1 Tax=Streptomyces sp. NPDC056161 TaxID=3345732 RepID=UPI0035DD13E2
MRRALPARDAVHGIGGNLARNSASYRVRLAGVLRDAGEVDEACAQMSGVLDGWGGISSPRLLGKVGEFQRAATAVDSTAARECGDPIRETVPGSTT